MSYVLSLMGAAAILEASSEGAGLAVNARWVDNGVTIERCLDNSHDTDTAVIKEGESQVPEMIAIIERNREDRERHVVMDR